MSVKTKTCFRCKQTVYEIDGMVATTRDGSTFPQKFNDTQGQSPHYKTCSARQQNQQQQQQQQSASKPAQQPAVSTPLVDSITSTAVTLGEIKGLSLQQAGIADTLIEINTKLDKLIAHVKGQPSNYTEYDPAT